MALITWTKESFGTNVSEPDQQHQTLFDMLNKLNDTVSGGDRKAVGEQLDGLIAFVAKHFEMEEKLMQQHSYPSYAGHKAEHDKLVQTCVDLQKKFHAGEAEITAETAAFVADWLKDHIPNIDKQYGPFFNEKGIN
jgi:hemerythrin